MSFRLHFSNLINRSFYAFGGGRGHQVTEVTIIKINYLGKELGDLLIDNWPEYNFSET